MFEWFVHELRGGLGLGVSLSITLSLSFSVCVCVCVCVCVRERERERERDRDRDRQTDRERNRQRENVCMCVVDWGLKINILPYLSIGTAMFSSKWYLCALCAHMRSIPSLRSFPNHARETFPMFVGLTMTISRPFREHHRVLPPSTPQS